MTDVSFFELRVFTRVADLASFTRAAEQLGLAKGRVSTVVRDLEAAVGARLLQRSTRVVRLTGEGERFLDRARDLLVQAEELGTMFGSDTAALTGRLRIDLPYVIAREVVIPRLPEFADAHPLVDLAVSTTDRRVDLVHEGFDCAMVVGPLQDSELAVRRLDDLPMINAASPAYLARHGMPVTRRDLAQHRLIHFSSDLSPRGAAWLCRLPDGECDRVAMPVGITVNGFDAYQAAAMAGMGLIQAPEPGLRRLIASGALVPVLPSDIAPPVAVSLLYPGRRQLAPRVRAMLDWLAGVMRSEQGTSEPRLD